MSSGRPTGPDGKTLSRSLGTGATCRRGGRIGRPPERRGAIERTTACSHGRARQEQLENMRETTSGACPDRQMRWLAEFNFRLAARPARHHPTAWKVCETSDPVPSSPDCDVAMCRPPLRQLRSSEWPQPSRTYPRTPIRGAPKSQAQVTHVFKSMISMQSTGATRSRDTGTATRSAESGASLQRPGGEDQPLPTPADRHQLPHGAGNAAPPVDNLTGRKRASRRGELHGQRLQRCERVL